MSEKTWWESIKVQGHQLVAKVKELIEEGNVRRIVSSSGRDAPEFPLIRIYSHFSGPTNRRNQHRNA